MKISINEIEVDYTPAYYLLGGEAEDFDDEQEIIKEFKGEDKLLKFIDDYDQSDPKYSNLPSNMTAVLFDGEEMKLYDIEDGNVYGPRTKSEIDDERDGEYLMYPNGRDEDADDNYDW